ncbi:uncharacterized protein [Amphiura filiformis]|uniref:uncharacterized protein n=1 Tax=Amphiura filiformis TaxID=82378 RepID=UPI003B22785A
MLVVHSEKDENSPLMTELCEVIHGEHIRTKSYHAVGVVGTVFKRFEKARRQSSGVVFLLTKNFYEDRMHQDFHSFLISSMRKMNSEKKYVIAIADEESLVKAENEECLYSVQIINYSSQHWQEQVVASIKECIQTSSSPSFSDPNSNERLAVGFHDSVIESESFQQASTSASVGQQGSPGSPPPCSLNGGPLPQSLEINEKPEDSNQPKDSSPNPDSGFVSGQGDASHSQAPPDKPASTSPPVRQHDDGLPHSLSSTAPPQVTENQVEDKPVTTSAPVRQHDDSFVTSSLPDSLSGLPSSLKSSTAPPQVTENQVEDSNQRKDLSSKPDSGFTSGQGDESGSEVQPDRPASTSAPVGQHDSSVTSSPPERSSGLPSSLKSSTAPPQVNENQVEAPKDPKRTFEENCQREKLCISIDPKGDGNCFFYSVLDQLKRLKMQQRLDDLKKEFGSSDEDMTHGLRQQLVEYMEGHPKVDDQHDAAHFFELEGETRHHEIWTNHCEKMKNSGEWIDNIEVAYMYQMLQKQIIVITSYSADEGKTCNVLGADESEPILLGHRMAEDGKGNREGLHFVSLKPIESDYASTSASVGQQGSSSSPPLCSLNGGPLPLKSSEFNEKPEDSNQRKDLSPKPDSGFTSGQGDESGSQTQPDRPASTSAPVGQHDSSVTSSPPERSSGLPSSLKSSTSPPQVNENQVEDSNQRKDLSSKPDSGFTSGQGDESGSQTQPDRPASTSAPVGQHDSSVTSSPPERSSGLPSSLKSSTSPPQVTENQVEDSNQHNLSPPYSEFPPSQGDVSSSSLQPVPEDNNGRWRLINESIWKGIMKLTSLIILIIWKGIKKLISLIILLVQVNLPAAPLDNRTAAEVGLEMHQNSAARMPTSEVKPPQAEETSEAIITKVSVKQRSSKIKSSTKRSVSLPEEFTRNLAAETSFDRWLNDEYLMDLAQQMGSDWEMLGVYLGFNRSEIERFRFENSSNILMAVHRMLIYWRRRQDPECQVKEVVGNLSKALSKCKRSDLAGRVLELPPKNSGGMAARRDLVFCVSFVCAFLIGLYLYWSVRGAGQN